MCPSASNIAEWHGGGHSPQNLEGMLTLALRSNSNLDANYGSSDERQSKKKRENLGILIGYEWNECILIDYRDKVRERKCERVEIDNRLR